jgi:hypothetical protein
MIRGTSAQAKRPANMPGSDLDLAAPLRVGDRLRGQIRPRALPVEATQVKSEWTIVVAGSGDGQRDADARSESTNSRM